MTMVKARQTSIDRIKRCCCTYINMRMERLRNLRWRAGGQLPNDVKVGSAFGIYELVSNVFLFASSGKLVDG